MKFSGKVGDGHVNKWLTFVGDPDHGIRIATLVRRALAEVCTVCASEFLTAISDHNRSAPTLFSAEQHHKLHVRDSA